MNYSQAAGGRMMEDIIDAMKRPDYGEIILSGAESTSALEKALMELNADVRGTEKIFDARVEAAKMGAADAATLANAGTWAAGASAIGQVAGAGISAFGKLPKKTEFSQPVPGDPGARETIGGYDSYETFDPNKYKIEIPKSIVMDTTGEYY